MTSTRVVAAGIGYLYWIMAADITILRKEDKMTQTAHDYLSIFLLRIYVEHFFNVECNIFDI